MQKSKPLFQKPELGVCLSSRIRIYVWRTVTTAADRFLDTLTPEVLPTYFEREAKSSPESTGIMLLRNVCHYWFHLGEAHAIRQMLGHTDLSQFVGDMSGALYRSEH